MRSPLHPKSALDPDSSFGALTGRELYRWQRRLFDEFLAKGETPDAVDVPTGLGKTMVMALWLIARAAGANLPRRLVYVVDRRAVVDQASEEAEKLAAVLLDKQDPQIGALRRGLGLADDQGLPVSTLRGQHADNRKWLKAPHLSSIVVGTIDMIGSRLLFEGYGASRRMRPYQAGLIGVDALIVLDEAHLVPAFEALLRDIASFEPVAPVPRFRAMSLSATGSERGGRVFALDANDIDGDEAARKRLSAVKRLTLRKVSEKDFAKAMARCAVDLANDGGRRVIVFANSRKTAQAIAGLIEKAATGAPKPVLLVGARRVRERERLERDEVFRRFSPEAGAASGPAFLVATSAGEVGVDLDADALVCDLASWERMVQRLGRVNRRAEPGEARVLVFDAMEDDGEDAVEDETSARKHAGDRRDKMTVALRKLLDSGKWEKDEDGSHDASPLALRRLKTAAATDADLRHLLEAATTPAPLRPALTPALLDAWSMTSLEAHTGRPTVEPWLRGWVDKEPQARVLWRRYLPPSIVGDARATSTRLDAFFEAAPPHLTEILETYAAEIAKLVKARAEATRAQPGASDPAARRRADFVLDDIAGVVLDTAGAVRSALTLQELFDRPPDARELAGQTLVLDARLGGLDDNGLLDAKSDSPTSTLDGASEDWAPEPEILGFRVRVTTRSAVSDPGWRTAFRCSLASDDDDEDSDEDSREMRVEVYRDRSASVGDLAIASKAQTLDEHVSDIVEEAELIADKLDLAPDLRAVLVVAARLHDRGKSRPLWQRAMGAPAGDVFAKTEGGGNPRLLTIGGGAYRHEFGSLRDATLDPKLNALPPDMRDLALHLIAAHHGFARPMIAALDPDEPPSRAEARAGEAALRFARLQKRWGWWGLAWLESLLRAADWAASERNDARGGVHG